MRIRGDLEVGVVQREQVQVTRLNRSGSYPHPDRKLDRPRVALFHPCLIHGGIPHVFIELARGLLEQDLDVDLVQATPPPAMAMSGSRTDPALGGDVRDQVPDGVRLVDLNTSRVLKSVLPLARYLRRERPQALISGALHANVAAAWACRISRISTRLVLTEHSIISAVVKNAASAQTPRRARVSPFFVRLFYPWAYALVAVSPGVATDLAAVSGIPRKRIHVIYNPIVGPELFARAGLPLDHAWFLAGRPPVIVAVGRLDHFKDYPVLLRAFAVLRRNRPARLLILGEGEERRSLEALVRNLDLEADVSMPGNVANPLPFMKRSAVFVLSSKAEAFPSVLIEALAAGAQIVATDCPFGPKEILEDGTFGRLVPVGDVDALARALEQALAVPSPSAPASALKRFSRDESIRAYCRLIGVPFTPCA
ncbi:MAG: glycosyltransferase [Terriglobales bacterium]|jgi:glycosyltransferase involved in cell wall biosynthesis